MKNKALIPSIGVIIALLLAVMAPTAHADDIETSSTQTKQITNCEFTGVVNVYAGKDEEVEVPVGTVLNTFRAFDCDKSGMRIYKTKGNTKAEFQELKRFARTHAYRQYPEVVCGDESRSRLLSLSYFYHRKYKKLRTVEKEKYKAFIKRYKSNHDNCRLYASQEWTG